MNLEDLTIEELEKELEKRKKIFDDKPKPLEKPDLTGLRICLEEYVRFIASNDYHEDNDYKHYIYEEAVETFYGRGFWDWLNSRMT
jgi:hypothetical protein